MDPVKNPFTPAAGTQPPEMAGRENNLQRADVILQRIKMGRPERSSLLIGLRGVGKTALLNRIKLRAEEHGYNTTIIESPEEKSLAENIVPALRQILLRIDVAASGKEFVHKALSALRSFASVFEITIGDFGVGVTPNPGTADSGIFDRDLIDLLVAVGYAAKESSSPVAIFIDELQYVEEKELGALLAGIHRINQLGLPLVVFGAGLPQLTGLTGDAKSYAERLFEFVDVGPLGSEDAKNAVKIPVEKEGAEIEQAALDEIVQETEGYPYFLQEWGRHAWNTATGSRITVEDIKNAGAASVAELDKGFFRVRFDRLTPSEKDYLRAMAELGNGPYRSGDIAKKLKRPVENVAPTRARVILKGMVYAPSHGDNSFTVPKFDEYMRRVMPVFKPSMPKKRSRKR